MEERLQTAAQLPQQERRQLEQDAEDTSGRVRSLLYLAKMTINTLAVSTTEVSGRGVYRSCLMRSRLGRSCGTCREGSV